MEKEDNRKTGAQIGGIAFTGFMFLGIGVGFLFDKVHVGGALGMGTGFLVMAAIRAYYREN